MELKQIAENLASFFCFLDKLKIDGFYKPFQFERMSDSFECCDRGMGKKIKPRVFEFAQVLGINLKNDTSLSSNGDISLVLWAGKSLLSEMYPHICVFHQHRNPHMKTEALIMVRAIYEQDQIKTEEIKELQKFSEILKESVPIPVELNIIIKPLRLE